MIRRSDNWWILVPRSFLSNHTRKGLRIHEVNGVPGPYGPTTSLLPM